MFSARSFLLNQLGMRRLNNILSVHPHLHRSSHLQTQVMFLAAPRALVKFLFWNLTLSSRTKQQAKGRSCQSFPKFLHSCGEFPFLEMKKNVCVEGPDEAYFLWQSISHRNYNEFSTFVNSGELSENCGDSMMLGTHALFMNSGKLSTSFEPQSYL